MNGPLAATTCIVAGAGAGVAVTLSRVGLATEGALFGMVAALACAELVVLVPWPRLLVCGLVASYAFLASFALPIGDPGRPFAHDHAEIAHATGR